MVGFIFRAIFVVDVKNPPQYFYYIFSSVGTGPIEKLMQVLFQALNGHAYAFLDLDSAHGLPQHLPPQDAGTW